MKTFTTIFYTLIIALTIWVGVSFIDIVSDNNEHNPEHSDLNFFKVMLELADGGNN